MSIKFKLISCLCVVFVLCVMVARIFIQDKQIRTLTVEVEILTEDARNNKILYSRLQDDIARQNQSIILMFDAQSKAQRDHAKRIETIETSEDARDWLDVDIPESIRMLFNPGCKDE